MSQRVVFDTATVLSALLFTNGRLAWLRPHWQEGVCVPLISRATIAELVRALEYPKFQLSAYDRRELLADYLPHCKVIEQAESCPSICQNPKNQPFLDLAQSAAADLLISDDQDLLNLAAQTSFLIESPEAYRRRIIGAE